jgi:hypothetical protein
MRGERGPGFSQALAHLFAFVEAGLEERRIGQWTICIAGASIRGLQANTEMLSECQTLGFGAVFLPQYGFGGRVPEHLTFLSKDTQNLKPPAADLVLEAH